MTEPVSRTYCVQQTRVAKSLVLKTNFGPLAAIHRWGPSYCMKLCLLAP